MSEYLAPERQQGIFDAAAFGDTEVHFIGVGGTGSNALWLALLLGIRNLHAHDGDILEAHNIHNQRYPRGEVGHGKVEALARETFRWTGVHIHAHPAFVEEPIALAGVVFLCVDDNDVRRHIYDTCIKGNDNIKLMLDLRMDGSYSILYTIDPRIEEQCAAWEHYWRPQSQAQNETAACGSPLSAATTATRIATAAVEQLIRSHAREQWKRDVKVPFAITYDLWTCEQHLEILW